MSETELTDQRLTEIAIAVDADAEFILRGQELPLLVEAARVGRIAIKGWAATTAALQQIALANDSTDTRQTAMKALNWSVLPCTPIKEPPHE